MLSYRSSRFVAPLLMAVLAVFCALAWARPAQGGPVPPLGINIIVNTNDGGQTDDSFCSLAEAIIALNTNSAGISMVGGCTAAMTNAAAVDGISFAASVTFIDVTATLPTISTPISIDGGPTRVQVHGPGGAFSGGAHGFTITGNNVGIARLVISNFQDDGIFSNGSNTKVLGNFIGTNAAGTASAPNQGFGVQIQGSGAVIGGVKTIGDCTGNCNVIGGNAKDGILLDVTSTNAVVKGNHLGTGIHGTEVVGSLSKSGVTVKGNGSVIGGAVGTTPGGACTGDCNVISANGAGILVDVGAGATTILGNFLGTTSSGTGENGNAYGIRIKSPNATVGNATAAGRNVISGNRIGMYLEAAVTVVGNYIGTASNGVAALGNDDYGIFGTQTTNAVIGGDNEASRNVITSNGAAITNGAGIRFDGSMSDLNSIIGNYIGPNANGTETGNVGYGVYLTVGASQNQVGGFAAGRGNVIRGNTLSGIDVVGQDAQRNEFHGNSIDNNGQLGINLEFGANEDAPAPVLTSAQSTAGNTQTRVIGTLSGQPAEFYSIDFFYSPACDGSGAGEGRTYAGFLPSTMADGFANLMFDETLVPGAASGNVVTATATDAEGNTSEFSICKAVTGSATPTPTPSPTPSPTPTGSASPSPSPTPTGSPGEELVQGDVTCNGVVDEEDFLFLMEYAAGLDDGMQPDPCPDLGDAVPAGTNDHPWGDVNCDDAVNAIDALFVLAHKAGIELEQEAGCVAIGDAIT